MSVNHHAVDIPVTDLDDEDDILFGEQGSTLNDVSDLDFERPQSNFKTKMKNWFSTPTQNSYEMVNFDDLGLTDSLELHESTKSLRVKKRRRFMISLGGLTTIIMVALVFYSFGRKSASGPAHSFKRKLSNSTHEYYPTTIVVSLDGFHPHYINEKRTPTLHKMMTNDYGAPYMIPSFPSSTFPNHWTLITGLYPSEHGIVGNTFYDPKLEKQFVNTDPSKGGLDPDFWQGGEPVWKTAHTFGVKSAIHMWPGSEVPGVGIDGGPMQVDRYNGSESLSSKVNRIISWLDSDIKNRPELILAYVPTIDLVGHKYGISGEHLDKSLQEVDGFVQNLTGELESRHLHDIVNLIVLSDHGMAPISNDRLLYLDDVVDLLKIDHIDGWPLYGLRPKPEFSVEDIYKEVKLSLKDYENFRLYKLDDFPPEWNFGAGHQFSYRLAPLWIVPEVGYAVTTHKNMEENGNDYSPKGVHGYNNTELLMRALFLGKGPYFETLLHENKRVTPFPNTEVYNMICESLFISSSPNNGSTSFMAKNILPAGWVDSHDYPSVLFEIEHLVHNATYDIIFRNDNVAAKPATQAATTPATTLFTSKSSKAESTVASTESKKPPSFWRPLHDIGEGLSNVGHKIEEGVGEMMDEIEDTFDDLFDDDKR